MPAVGNVAKCSVPSTSRKSYWSSAPPPNAALPNNAWWLGSVPLANCTCNAWRISTARSGSKPENYSIWFENMGRNGGHRDPPGPCRRSFRRRLHCNLLHQQRRQRTIQPPLRFHNPQLNELATDPLSLADYDAFILHAKKASHDLPATETTTTEPDHHELPTGMR